MAEEGSAKERQAVVGKTTAAVGVAGFFIETHPDPDNAPSDGPVMMYLDKMGDLLDVLMELDQVAKARPVSLG